ncbi:MAG: hypothetical protein JSS21_05310, partial [Proteobacteria bacterium]|nr:hypothetical protein [Pseudomonadota bacterium]
MTQGSVFASALVFGASSQIGHCLLPSLTAQGARVVAVSRTPRADRTDRVQWLRGS